MWRTVIFVGFLFGSSTSSPVGLKNMPIMDNDDGGYTLTKSEMAMAALNLPSNATSIRAVITDGFNCDNRPYGYYADVDNDCQIFHVCLPVTYPDGKENMFRWSFICPEETVFSQESFTCVRNIDMTFGCDESERFYHLNRNFGINPDESIEIPNFDGQVKHFGDKIPAADQLNDRKPALKTTVEEEKVPEQPILPLYNRRVPARFGATEVEAQQPEGTLEEKKSEQDVSSGIFAPPNAVLKAVVHESVEEVVPTEDVESPANEEHNIGHLKAEEMIDEDKPSMEESSSMNKDLLTMSEYEDKEAAIMMNDESASSSIDLPENEDIKAAEIDVAVPQVKLGMDMKEEVAYEEGNQKNEEQVAVSVESAAKGALELESTAHASALPETTEPKMDMLPENHVDKEPMMDETYMEDMTNSMEPVEESAPKQTKIETSPAMEESMSQESEMKSADNKKEATVEKLEMESSDLNNESTLEEMKPAMEMETMSLKNANMNEESPMPNEMSTGSTDEIPIPVPFPEEAEEKKEVVVEQMMPVEHEESQLKEAPEIPNETVNMNAESMDAVEQVKDATQETEPDMSHDTFANEDNVADSTLKSEQVLTASPMESTVGVVPEIDGENLILKGASIFNHPYPMYNKEMMIPVRIVTDGDVPEDFFNNSDSFAKSSQSRTEEKPADDETNVENVDSVVEELKKLSEESVPSMDIPSEETVHAEEPSSEVNAIPVAEMILNNPLPNEEPVAETVVEMMNEPAPEAAKSNEAQEQAQPSDDMLKSDTIPEELQPMITEHHAPENEQMKKLEDENDETEKIDSPAMLGEVAESQKFELETKESNSEEAHNDVSVSEKESLEMKTIEEPQYVAPVDMLKTETFSAQENEIPFVLSFNEDSSPNKESKVETTNDADPLATLERLLQTVNEEFHASPSTSESGSDSHPNEPAQVSTKSNSNEEEVETTQEGSLKNDIDVNNSVYSVAQQSESIQATSTKDADDTKSQLGRSLNYKMDPRKRRFLFRS